MDNVLNISKPCTVLVTFKACDKDNWTVTSNGRAFHFREFKEFPCSAKISFPFAGRFVSDISINKIKIMPLERFNIFLKIPIPKPERNYNPKSIRIETVEDLSNTPARTWAKEGLIQKSDKLDSFPSQVAFFILLHELGHQKYFTEWKTDLFALYHFLRLGYNESQAMYALTKVLNRNDENVKRILKLYNVIVNK